MSTQEAFEKLATEVELQNEAPHIARVRRIQFAIAAEVEALRAMPASLAALEEECRKAGEEVIRNLAGFKDEQLNQNWRERVRNLRTHANNVVNLPKQKSGEIKKFLSYVDNLKFEQVKTIMEHVTVQVLRERALSLATVLEQTQKAPAAVRAARDQLLKEMEKSGRLTNATEEIRGTAQ